MIQDTHKISVDSPELRALFQQEILDHWLELKGSAAMPSKRGFRPQKFPQSLGQLAIVSIDDGGNFNDRLKGGLVNDVLKLSEGNQQLAAPFDTKIAATIKRILTESRDAAEPMYFTGRLHPPVRPPVDFSVLIVPFGEEDDSTPTSLLLAFDFTKHAATKLFEAT
ncbi:MAG: PAS domain-containing protein [Kordiimonas sp.]